jgi:branched-chain amino acid transport system ATP-binding protein
MSILEVESLDVRYGHFRAVRSVGFSLEKGDILALIGANGAGKTSLLRALAGAHAPHAGKVRFNGRDLTGTPSQDRVRTGLVLVPEGRRLFSAMSVEENLRLAAAIGRKGPWNIERIFDLFPNLVSRRHAKAANLSGGEQQATAIGRALVTNPDLVLLDEVSLGLSPLVVDQVYGSLDKLMASGTTIVLVEQDLGRAMGVANRVMCMLEGEIVVDRPTAELTRQMVTDAYFGHGRAARQAGAPA